MEISIDPKKRLEENLEAKQKQWLIIEEQKFELEKEIIDIKQKINQIPQNNGKLRIEKGNLTVKLKELEDKLVSLNKKNDFKSFVSSFAKWTKYKTSPFTEVESSLIVKNSKPENDSKNELSGNYSMNSDNNLIENININDSVEDTNDSLDQSIDKDEDDEKEEEKINEGVEVNLRKSKNKKKKEKNKDTKNMVRMKNISESFGVKITQTDKNVDQDSKQLAQWTKEIPLDQSEIEMCPYCAIVPMKFKEKPPSKVCDTCGYTKDILDTSSSLIHDKETNGHTPFFYRPWFHFRNWVQYFVDEQNYVMDKEDLDEIYLELGKGDITNVKDVTWEIINRILHKIAQRKSHFTELYPHVYQITNIIRGSPVVTFSEDLKKVIFSLFNPIYSIWEPIKERLKIDRDNFLSNPIILQIIFIFLDMPTEIISMLNLLKGKDNRRMYDSIIKEICKELNRDVVINTSMIEVMRYGKMKSVYKSLGINESQEDEIIISDNNNNNNIINNNNNNINNNEIKTIKNSFDSLHPKEERKRSSHEIEEKDNDEDFVVLPKKRK
jgi:hypothetical protein